MEPPSAAKAQIHVGSDSNRDPKECKYNTKPFQAAQGVGLYQTLTSPIRVLVPHVDKHCCGGENRKMEPVWLSGPQCILRGLF